VDSPEVRGGYRYLPLDRMAYYVHKESYLRTVQREIGRLRADLAPGAGAA